MANECRAPELLENWLASSVASMSDGEPGGYPGMRVELGPQRCAGVEGGEALCLPCLPIVHKIELVWEVVGVQWVVEPVPWLGYLRTKPWEDLESSAGLLPPAVGGSSMADRGSFSSACSTLLGEGTDSSR